MTVGGVTDHTVDVTAPADAQALFEEARRRRRRRFVWAGLTFVLLATALVLALVVSTGSGPTVAPTATVAAGAVVGRHSVRTVTFAASFVPQQVVSASGKIWVLGSTSTTCAIAEVEPASLRTTTFALPACGSYVSVGDGRIFLADGVFTAATDSNAFHIESFDTTTHLATVMGPVDITTTGTGYAHMDMTYAAGFLWLAPWSSDVLQISTATGAVVRSITGEPASNGGHPLVAGSASGLWSAPGVGGPEVIDRLAPQSSTPVNVFRATAPGGIWFLSAVGGRMWAEVANSRDEGRHFVTGLIAFDSAGHQVLQVPFRQLGESAIVGSGDDLWALTAAPGCTGPQRLWRIDGRTGASVVTTFRSPVVPCPADFEPAQLAAVGGRVFVLNADAPGPADTLFRIST